jgi:hypothetical protein
MLAGLKKEALSLFGIELKKNLKDHFDQLSG